MLCLEAFEGGQIEGHLHICIKKAIIAISTHPPYTHTPHAKPELAWSQLNLKEIWKTG